MASPGASTFVRVLETNDPWTEAGDANAQAQEVRGARDAEESAEVKDNDSDVVEEKSVFQAVSDILVESVQSVKEVVSGASATSDTDEKSVLQSVGTAIVQSAQSVKEAVTGSSEGKSPKSQGGTGPDESAEASILVHSALD